jgi:hypothetical protein
LFWLPEIAPKVLVLPVYPIKNYIVADVRADYLPTA